MNFDFKYIVSNMFKKANVPFLVFAVMLVLGLYFYLTKPAPAPQVIYITMPDSSAVYKQQADSIAHIFAFLAKENDVLKHTLAKEKDKHNSLIQELQAMPATDQVKLFGQSVGDTTLQMRSHDSATLVPLPCILKANILIAQGEQARREAEIASQMNEVYEQMIEQYKQSQQASREYISYLEREKNTALSANLEKIKELDKQKRKTKLAGYLGAAGWGLAVLAILL